MKNALIAAALSMTVVGNANAATQIGTIVHERAGNQTYNFTVPPGNEISSADITSSVTTLMPGTNADLFVDGLLLHSFFTASTYAIILNDEYLDRLKDGRAVISFVGYARNGQLSNDIRAFTTIRVNSSVTKMTPMIPEPAGWAMLLVGFAMIGGTARYRRDHSGVRYA